MGNNHKMMYARQSTPMTGEVPQNGRNRGNDDDEDDEGGVIKALVPIPKPYQVYHTFYQQQVTDFYLTENIGKPSDYTDMIHRIQTANKQDIIRIHLNTGGGRLDTGIAILNAMKSSDALIVGILNSKAYSLGTLLFLGCDEFQVHDDCMFMIHNFSSSTSGKGNEQHSELTATIEWFKELANKYYIPFLTKEELELVLSGKDMWMRTPEIKRRLKRMVAIQNGADAEDVDFVETKKPTRAKPKTKAKAPTKAAPKAKTPAKTAAKPGPKPKAPAKKVPAKKAPTRRAKADTLPE